MVVGREEVAEVARWAEGIERVHECIAGRFRRPEPRRRALDYPRFHEGRLCGDCSVPWSGRTAGNWQSRRATPLPTGCSACCTTTGGTRTWSGMTSGTMLWSIWATPVGLWWWTRPGFSRRAASPLGCSVGVFLTYASAKGRTLLDRELYLPQVWAQDRERREEAGVPEDAVFWTKPQLAQLMLERAADSGVPFAWFTGDEVYGSDRKLRLWLEREGIPHVMAIKSNEKLWALTDKGPLPVRADRLVSGVEESAWSRCSAGNGAKGPRVYDWTAVEIRPLREPGKGHWLLARRSLAKPGELAYYVCFGPAETALAELVRVAGTGWAIEECFEEAKGQSLPPRRRGWVWTSTRCGGGTAGTGTSPWRCWPTPIWR